VLHLCHAKTATLRYSFMSFSWALSSHQAASDNNTVVKGS